MLQKTGRGKSTCEISILVPRLVCMTCVPQRSLCWAFLNTLITLMTHGCLHLGFSALEQAQEVQTGLWLLQQSLNTLQTSVTNTAMHSHIDNTIRNLLSINAVLRSLNIQEFTPPANATDLEGTWRVSLATDLLQVHVNFLRGKVHLLLSSAQACKPDVS
uniref:Erythropoietin n=1 Tax=Neolamprologus brichardi TaxID=32507 RepID=A0A3Q4GMP0_NEOBR